MRTMGLLTLGVWLVGRGSSAIGDGMPKGLGGAAGADANAVPQSGASQGGTSQIGGIGGLGVAATCGTGTSIAGAGGIAGSASKRLVAKAVAAGISQNCAVLSDGTVQCWGWGELGDGVTTTSSVPVAVAGS